MREPGQVAPETTFLKSSKGLACSCGNCLCNCGSFKLGPIPQEGAHALHCLGGWDLANWKAKRPRVEPNATGKKNQ